MILVGNVGEVPRVSERDGEAFVANFPLATNQFYRNKEGEEISKTEWHQIVNMSGTLISTTYLKRVLNYLKKVPETYQALSYCNYIL